MKTLAVGELVDQSRDCPYLHPLLFQTWPHSSATAFWGHVGLSSQRGCNYPSLNQLRIYASSSEVSIGSEGGSSFSTKTLLHSSRDLSMSILTGALAMSLASLSIQSSGS